MDHHLRGFFAFDKQQRQPRQMGGFFALRLRMTSRREVGMDAESAGTEVPAYPIPAFSNILPGTILPRTSG
jgi:hypothetical protein